MRIISSKLLLSAFFLLGVISLHAQEDVMKSKDTLYVKVCLEQFSKYIQDNNVDSTMYYAEKLLRVYDKYNLERDSTYCYIAGVLNTCYSFKGKVEESISLLTDILPTIKSVFGENNSFYATSLDKLAFYHSKLGYYAEAVKMATEAMEISKKILGPEHPDYAASLDNVALYHYHLENYSEAVRLGTEAMEIRKKVLGTENPDYARSLNNLALYHSKLGNYSEAIRLGTEAMEIRKKVLGTENPDYARSLNNLALYHSKLGNYSEAIRLGTEAMEIQKKVLSPENPDYATSLNNLALYHSHLDNYAEAVRMATEAMEIQKKVLGSEHPDYARSLNNLALYHSDLGNYAEAVRLGTEAMEIWKKVLGPKHPDYALSLNNTAHYYFKLGNYSEAVRLATEAMEIQKKVLGPEHPDYASSLSNLASCYTDLGNYAETYHLLTQSLDKSREYVLNSFSELSSGLRETLWNNNYSYLFNMVYPSVVFKHREGGSISELYNKTALFAKGILLNSSIGMRQLILESGDDDLLNRYDALLSNISIYEKQLEKPIAERTIDMDSLRNAIQHQEMMMSRDSKAYGDFARNMRINWQDVQKKLGGKDIAVEFLEIPLWDSDSTMYVALTLKKDYKSPRMITLFEKKQLKAIPKGIYYTRTALYNLIWKPLEAELAGVKDIYFAPSGELHCIGIEYVPVNSDENLCDRYAMHRLSSTRQLAFIEDNTNGEEVVLYGGLKYETAEDCEKDIPKTSIKREKKNRGYDFINHVNIDSLALRGSYEYLPGTKNETDKIESNLRKHSIPYTYYYGYSGTEETFKELNGTKPRILHIATHGFYLTQTEAERKNFARSMLHDDRQAYHEDKAMTRSGLLLSHCKPTLDHKTIGEGIEDGILTAQEISKLDLRGLDLVVLSACQTGLGDIVSGEGVFGLQRGFKNAGARTVLMSLWKVSDSETQKLMSSFYNYYLKGMSKEQAFRLAQEELRKNSIANQKKPDWAAFVMLDGIK